MLEIQHLRKKYKRHQVLRDVQFTLDENQVLGLIGPNGAGKTTIIESICGLVRYDAGTILMDGVSLEREPALRRRIGCCFQENVFDRFFNIYDTIVHNAMYHGLAPKEARRSADEALEKVRLTSASRMFGNALSGGMKKRFQLAMAMVSDPELLILDEPSAGVDLELSELIHTIILDFSKQQGKAVLLTGHDIHEMERLCTRAVFIKDGLICEDFSIDASGRLESEYRRLYMHE